ncbi:MAG: M28 family peptidase [Bacteroidales bacterium]|nr:M28 family peptidase [Bacteroidales bacterium]
MRLAAKIFCFFCVSALSFTGFAQGIPFRIPESELREGVEYLCDSLCGGRGFASRGSVETQAYLSRQLSGLGFRPVFQRFAAEVDTIKNGCNVLVEIYASRQYRSRAGTIVVMAHYDGIGTHSGRLFPGADSNASGVAAMLAILRHMYVYGSKNNLVFAFLDGHSASMSGSRALFESLQDRKITCAVSLDILGASLSPVKEGEPDYLIALGGDKWKKELSDLNSGLDLHLYYDYYGSPSFTDLFYRRIGDQSVFVEAGVPSLMFTSGITMNTNKETDTPDSLNWPVYRKRAELIMRLLEVLSGR